MENRLGFSALLLSLAASACLHVPAAAQQAYSLEDCRRMALENNKRMAVMDQKVLQAREERKSAFTKNLPSVSVTGTYMFNSRETSLISEDMMLPIGSMAQDGSFTFTPDQVSNQFTLIDGQYVPLDASGQPFNPKTNPEKILWKQYTTIPKDALTFDTRNVFAAAVSLTQPVYMGGKIRAYNKITRFAENLAESRKDTEATEVILTADQAYWQIVSLENKKKLALSYLSLLEKLSKDVSSLKKAGLATRSDELSVEVRLNEARMTLTQVEDGITLSKMNLAQICGLPMEEDFSLSDSDMTEQKEPTAVEVNMNSAVEKRHEVQSLTLAVDMYREKQKVARAEFLPTLAVTGNYMMSSPNVFNGFSLSPKGLFNVGVILKVPVFNWNDRSHKMKIAKADTRIAELELQEAREKIELQINQSVFYRRAAERKADMSVSNLRKATENLRYADLSYKEGAATLTNVFEAQTAWLSANSQNIDALIDLRMADVYLRRATGTLLPENYSANTPKNETENKQ